MTIVVLITVIIQKCFVPLHISAKHGRVEIMKLLLDKGADVNAESKNGLTPLHIATHYNQNAAVDLLLDSGASINCTVKVYIQLVLVKLVKLSD